MDENHATAYSDEEPDTGRSDIGLPTYLAKEGSDHKFSVPAPDGGSPWNSLAAKERLRASSLYDITAEEVLRRYRSHYQPFPEDPSRPPSQRSFYPYIPKRDPAEVEAEFKSVTPNIPHADHPEWPDQQESKHWKRVKKLIHTPLQQVSNALLLADLVTEEYGREDDPVQQYLRYVFSLVREYIAVARYRAYEAEATAIDSQAKVSENSVFSARRLLRTAQQPRKSQLKADSETKAKQRFLRAIGVRDVEDHTAVPQKSWQQQDGKPGKREWREWQPQGTDKPRQQGKRGKGKAKGGATAAKGQVQAPKQQQRPSPDDYRHLDLFLIYKQRFVNRNETGESSWVEAATLLDRVYEKM